LYFHLLLQHLQNLIHKAEKVVHEHARNTELDDTTGSSLLVKSNVGVLLQDQRGLYEEVVALQQELQCINQRINGFQTAATTTSNLTNSRGTHTVANMGDGDDVTHQQVCQDATQIWQALLQLQEQALISRQWNNLLAAAQPGHLQVAATGPTTAGAFQPAGVPQSWLQSGQMQQGFGTGSYARQPNLSALATLPPQVTPGSVLLRSQMQLLPGAASSDLLHPHVLAAIHGYPPMIGHGHPVQQQLGLPIVWGHPHVAVDPTTAASFFLPTVAQSVLLMPPSGQMQQKQLSASGTTAASSSSGPAPADAVLASTATARQPLSPQMLYILQRMRMTTTGLQHPPAPPGV
jgi:hypothetical protein